MKRRLTGLVVAVVLTLMLGALAGASAQPADGEAADLLPWGTAAYLKLSDLDRVYRAAQESGFVAALKAAIPADRVGLSAEAAAWDKILQQVRAAHVCFYDVRTIEDEIVDLDMLLVLDGALGPDPRVWASPLLMPLLRPAGTFGQTQLYEIWHEEMAEEMPVEVLLAGVEGRFLFCTDRILLEGVLEALQGGRAQPLSANPQFQTATQGLAARDVLLYVDAARVIKAIERSLPEWDRDEFQEGVTVLGQVVCAAYGQDYEGRVATIRALLDPEGELNKLLTLRAARPRVPDFLPQDTLLFAGVNVEDGRASWQALADYICSRGMAAGALDSREQFYEGLAEAEAELGFRFEDAASLLAGELGAVLIQPDLETGGALFGFARDVAQAQQVLQAIENAVDEDPTRHRVEEHRGVGVHVCGGEGYEVHVWSILDGCAFVAPKSNAIKACIDARKDAAALSQSAQWRGVSRNLHPASALTFFVNLDALVNVVPRGLFPIGLGAAGDALRGVGLGASVTVEQGVLEVRIASNQRSSLRELFAVLKGPFAGPTQ